MTEIIKVIAICVFTMIIIAYLKNYSPHYTPIIAMSAGLLILGFCIPRIKKLIIYIESISKMSSDISSYILLIIKILFISLVCEFSSKLCIDNGESYLAAKINFVGKIGTIALCIPILTSLLKNVIDIIE